MLRRRRDPVGTRPVWVDLDHGRVRVLAAGPPAAPPLLLIHGLGMSAAYWTAYTFPALGGAFRLLAPDLPGYGGSAPLPRHTLAAYTDAVRALLDRLAPQAPVHVLGHSMGGQIALGLAAAAPAQVRSLTLVGAAGLPWREPPWQVSLRAATDRCNFQPRLLAYGFQAGPFSRVYRECVQMIMAGGTHLPAALARITAPTLLVWGAQDRQVPPAYGRALARLLPNARLAIGRGLGHVPFFERPAAFHRLVAGFLAEH